MSGKQTQVVFKGFLTKANPVKKIAYGWAYISKKGSGEVVDHSGQVWDIAEVTKTAHEFVMNCRVGGESHIYKGGADLVESMIFDSALQDALGINIQKDGESVEGWFVGFLINDEELLQKVAKGELAMFSIGGSGSITEEV